MLREGGVQGQRTPQVRKPKHQGLPSIGLNVSRGSWRMSQDERREVEEPSACLCLSRVVAEPVFAEGFVATRSAPGLASDISGGAKTMLLCCLRTPARAQASPAGGDREAPQGYRLG